MTQHTPGPWIACRVAGDFDIYPGTDGPAFVSIYSAADTAEGDARLIAAAPELLEAVRWIAANYENGMINHVDFRVEAKKRADAAIAKAEGRDD